MSSKAATEQKKDARWAVMMEKQDIKIELEMEGFVVKKRKEDFTIMTTNTSNMDPETMEWYMEERDSRVSQHREQKNSTEANKNQDLI
jgi:hypothetical protein